MLMQVLRSNKLIYCFKPLFIYLGIQFLIILGLFMFDFNTNMNKVNQEPVKTNNELVLLSSMFISLLIFRREIREIFRNSYIDLRKELNVKLLAKLFGYPIIIRVVVIIPAVILILIDEDILEKGSGNTIGWTTSVVRLFVACLVAPIFEELLFRGMLLPRLSSQCTSYRKANLLQTLAFMLLHGSLSSIMVAFFFGLFQGYLRRKYKSIFIPIISHIMLNGFGIGASIIMYNT